MARLGFAEIIAIPIECATSGETGEKIVGSDSSAAADNEKAQCCWEKNV